LSRANFLQIETSIHEILALLHIFLSRPRYHSEKMIDAFSKEILYDIHQSFVQELMSKNIDITNGISASVVHFIDSVKQRIRPKDQATILLSQLSINLDEHASSVIRRSLKPRLSYLYILSRTKHRLASISLPPLISTTYCPAYYLTRANKSFYSGQILKPIVAQKKKDRCNDYQAESVDV
jgi:hypothetical protein